MSVATLVSRHEVERGSDAKTGVVFTFEDDRGVRTRFVSRIGLTRLQEKGPGPLPLDTPLLDLFDAHLDFILTVASVLLPEGERSSFEIDPGALANAMSTGGD